ncbi:hypothetical protein KGV52_00635 [Candidatus Gracilibacteria bacterium]|nr:hypothetical protein [Candidatus Gracilibacteria bacterium]
MSKVNVQKEKSLEDKLNFPEKGDIVEYRGVKFVFNRHMWENNDKDNNFGYVPKELMREKLLHPEEKPQEKVQEDTKNDVNEVLQEEKTNIPPAIQIRKKAKLGNGKYENPVVPIADEGKIIIDKVQEPQESDDKVQEPQESDDKVQEPIEQDSEDLYLQTLLDSLNINNETKNPQKPNEPENPNQIIEDFELPKKTTTIFCSISENKDTLEKIAKKLAGERLAREIKESNIFMKIFKNSFDKNRLLKKYTQEALKELSENMFEQKVANATNRFELENTSEKATIDNDSEITNLVNQYIDCFIGTDDFQKNFQNIITNIKNNHPKSSISQIEEMGTNTLLKIEPYKNYKLFLNDVETEQNPDQKRILIENFISNYENRTLLESQIGFQIDASTKDKLYTILSDSKIINQLLDKEFHTHISVRNPAEVAYNLDYKKAEKETGAFYKSGNIIKKHPYLSAIGTSIGMGITTLTGPFAKIFGALGIGTLAATKTNKEITENHKLIQERATLGEYSQAEVFDTIQKLEAENKTAGRWRKFWNNGAIAKQKLYLKTGKNKKILTKQEFEKLNDENKKIKVIQEGVKVTFSKKDPKSEQQKIETFYFTNAEYESIKDTIQESVKTDENLEIIEINQNTSVNDFYSPEEFEQIKDTVNKNAKIEYFTFEKNKGTLHRHLAPTRIFTKKIHLFLDRNNSNFDITTDEGKQQLEAILAHSLARIHTSKKTGNSYLKSKNIEDTEKELNELYKAIGLGVQALGIQFSDLENHDVYKNITQQLTEDSDFAHENFKKMRKKEMLKSAGIGSSAYLLSSFLFSELNEHFNPKETTITTGTNNSANSSPAETVRELKTEPIFSTEIDPKIQNILDKHNINITDSLKDTNKGENLFYDELLKATKNSAEAAEIKNDILKNIFNLTDENGKSKLIEIAAPHLKNADASKITENMIKYGYNVDENFVKNILAKLKNNSLDPKNYPNFQQELAEVLFHGVDQKDFGKLFFDTVESGSYVLDISESLKKVTGKISTQVTETIQRETNFLDYLSSLGIPVFRNKYVSPLKNEEKKENKKQEKKSEQKENINIFSNVEPIQGGETNIFKKEDLKQVVEAPLLPACEVLFDKGIRTTLSGANQNGTTPHIMIDYATLSEKNKKIAQQLGKLSNSGSVPNSCTIEITPQKGETLTQFTNRAKNIMEQFEQQEALWIKEYFSYKTEAEAHNLGIIPYYDNENDIFFNNEEAYNTYKNSLKNKQAKIEEKETKNETVSLKNISPEHLQDFQKNMSEMTANLIQKNNIFQPVQEVKIDGRIFLFAPETDINKQIFYTKVNGKYELRAMRLSGSGQKWHVFPGFISGFKYSKGETTWGFDYESGVVADKRLVQALSTVQKYNGLIEIKPLLDEAGYISENIETKENLKEFEKITVINNKDLNKTLSFDDIKYSWEQQTPEQKKEILKHNKKKNIYSVIINKNPNFQLDKNIFGEKLEYTGEYRHYNENDKEKHELSFGEYDGKKVFARIVHKKNEPDLCWVEEIFVDGSPITSFGIPKHRISSGAFTTKPKEYGDQIPDFIVQQFLQDNPKHKKMHDGLTYDIRKYIQGNPFIVKFKEARDSGKLGNSYSA